jgi:HK97 gp10 family phage protein
VIGPAVKSDLGELVQALHSASRNIQHEAQEILEKTGEEIAEKMRAIVPVDTGRLKASIRVITEPGRVTVGPVGVEYAYYVEYGTGSRGEFAQLKTKNNTVMIKTRGQWVPLKKPTGQRPQPYMRPAAVEVLQPLGVPYAEAGARLIKGQANV